MLVLFIGLVVTHFLLLYLAWYRYATIPARQYKLWFVTLNEGALVIPMMIHIRVRIQLRVHSADEEEQQITVSIPPKITLGDLFSRFVIQRRKIDQAGIDLEDDRCIPYAWEFSVTKLGGMVKWVVDPEKTWLENKLKDRSIIVVKRCHPIAK